MKNAKKLTALFITVIMALGAFAAAPFTAGAADPVYEISNYEDLVAFAVVVNGNEGEGFEPNPSACAVLTADILCPHNEWDADYAKWVPIAKDSGCAFTGTFDGQGYKIIGLNNSESYNRNDSGLFGFIGEGGVVQNTALENATLTGDCIGGIAYENNGTIQKCSFDGSIIGDIVAGGITCENLGTITSCYCAGSVSGNYEVGGVAGENYDAITNCYNTGSVTGNNAAGGIAGLSNGTIENCYNTGNVSGNTDVGGVAGSKLNDGKVTNCYNTGSVTGNDVVGGIVGYMSTNNPAWAPEIANCYSAGSVTATDENAQYAGGVVGYLESGAVENCYYDNEKCTFGAIDGADDAANSVKGLSTAEMTGTDALTNLSGFSDEVWSVTDSYTVLKWQLPGSGPAQTVYEISSYADLVAFAVVVNGNEEEEIEPNPSACAVLTADILCPHNKWDEDYAKWVPIAKDSGCAFTGTFDGQGYKIIGLNNSESDNRDYNGLFGFIGEGGVVQNTALENATLTGDCIGGIAYENNGTIISCSFDGSIIGDIVAGGIAESNYGTVADCYNKGSVSGNYAVGGVLGYNYNTGTLTNSYNTGSVTGNNAAGGIAGSSNGTIENCYNTGNVSGNTKVGGVAGNNMNGGKVTNCYNTGSVTGNNAVGGIVGYMNTNNPAWATEITNCYSAGEVTLQGEDAEYAGGVLGYNYSCTVENCYYDNEKCALTKAVGNTDDPETVKGLSTAEMTGTDALTNLSGFSDEVWSVTDSYPVLKWQADLPITVIAHSLTLNGDIGVNFYADVPVPSTETRAEFTVDGKTVTVPIDPAEYTVQDGVKLYKFSCNVAAAQIDTEITGTIGNNINENAVITYSVQDYLTEAQQQMSDNESLMALAGSLATYGCYANDLFGYNNSFTQHSLFDDSGFADITATSLAEYDTQITNSEGGVNYIGSSLVLRTRTSIRHYFTLPADKTINDYTFLLGEGDTASELTPVQSGNRYFVEIPGIASALLGEMQTVSVIANAPDGGTAAVGGVVGNGYNSGTVGNGYNTGSVQGGANVVNTWTYSALTYVYKALTQYEAGDPAVSDALANTVKALTVYYRAADAYFKQFGN